MYVQFLYNFDKEKSNKGKAYQQYGIFNCPDGTSGNYQQAAANPRQIPKQKYYRLHLATFGGNLRFRCNTFQLAVKTIFLLLHAYPEGMNR